MATLIPSYDKILSLKVKPEEGELHLLKFLDSQLDQSFEVYFNPYMNGDRPDIVIMKQGQGILIVEVKDYDLNSYELDERKNFVIKSNKTKTHKSPVSQVLKYKDNLFELHIENLLEKKIKDIRHFNTVSCAIYFHNATSDKIKELLVEPYEHDNRYLSFLKYNIDFIGRDNLNEFDLKELLKNRYLISKRPSFLFTDDIYSSIKRFLKPPVHLKEEGEDIRYSQKQLEIIYESNRKQQRIKGVVGSGKTTVLAARAVQAHKRTKGNVLILTFNITLKNFIKDKISKVREDFSWEHFVISNYHLFINSELNNLGIPIKVPDGFDEYTEEQKDDYFEKEYYSNKELFIENKDKIKPYDVILIDEIQDYKRPWMEIIKECFLVTDGEYVLFGDVKQNIYNNQTEGKDISTNVKGVNELKNCFRSGFKIKDLAIHYQKDIFKDKYEIDSFNQKSQTLEIEFERNQQGSINYIFLPNADSVSSLYTIIHENAINRDIPPNDITVLGNSIGLLKKFDAFYRYSSNERTNTMFETFEMVYRMGLNYLKNNRPDWLKSGITLIKRQNDRSEARGFNQLSTLFTLNDLYVEYPDRFRGKLEFYCERFSTKLSDFLDYLEKYKEELGGFKKEFGPERQSGNLKMIRNNKKIHFYMNSGTVKISTIHSFKGWESETVFLILEDYNFQMTFDEILYTGITRTRANLILINYGNQEYHTKLKDLIEKVK
ncbi:DNA helicase II related protein [Indibacter alkaliphilus LW1]|uniref:DNA 3'-5' helicase II n=1 Tax=Indibacter alkaliphilus (strain CCUG 57479 / KCTC 22604 / LW1) TaxID=1189612 RepID=S2CZ84_INDAL|nr:NERD domain-containing protein [Indibacter alkaliphilus]EOZ91929.1 DNA helicase II related protein [Indibacter alkaliphilus LW1]